MQTRCRSRSQNCAMRCFFVGHSMRAATSQMTDVNLRSRIFASAPISFASSPHPDERTAFSAGRFRGRPCWPRQQNHVAADCAWPKSRNPSRSCEGLTPSDHVVNSPPDSLAAGDLVRIAGEDGRGQEANFDRKPEGTPKRWTGRRSAGINRSSTCQGLRRRRSSHIRFD